MTEVGEVFKCEVCGNIVEVMHDGDGKLVCCEKPMVLQVEHTSDPKLGEKHVPMIVERLVVVGVNSHPMTDEHYIEWIEATNGHETSKVFLAPGGEPRAEFSFVPTSAKAYCNLHGLWRGSISSSDGEVEL